MGFYRVCRCPSPLTSSLTLNCIYEDLLAKAQDSHSKVLALSTAIHHAGDWLNVIPSKALGLHLHDWEFRLCLQYWLGLQLVEEGTACPICQAMADPLGDHQVGCGGNGDRSLRHDSIYLGCNLFSGRIHRLVPQREVPSLILGSSSRPVDVYLPNWKRRLPAVLDVTVISTLQHLTLEGTATTQGHALSVEVERKMVAHAYAVACWEVGVAFIPLVIESLGGWSDDASKISHWSSAGAKAWHPSSRFFIPATFSSAWPSREGMPPCGFVASPLDLLRWTGLFSCSCRVFFY